MQRPLFNASILFLSLLLSACGSRPVPAPVIEVYQGRSIHDFEKDAFDEKFYTVKKGDTLFSIAWYSGNDYRDIAAWNNISRPYSIYPGQKLRVNKLLTKEPQREIKSPGQTSKTKAKQAVDPPKKQAYGDHKEVAGNQQKPQDVRQFPSRVKRWVWPAKGKVINQFSLQELGNKGIDITGRRGDDIVAAADGKVVYAGNALRGFGNLVIVKHSESFLSAYAHNDSILVQEQQWVSAGQKIASMGSSGTDSVMLHFEVRYKGKSVDPVRYLPTSQ